MGKFAVALVTTTALAFTVGHASAADLSLSGALPGGPPFAPPQHIWSGIYVGANAGGAFGKFSASATSGPFTADLGSVNASGLLAAAKSVLKFSI